MSGTTSSAPLRVLLVEDVVTDAKLIARELRRTGRVVEWERVETGAAMRAALATGDWHAVISDWSMPRFSALEAYGVLKATGLDLPFIIVSGTIGEELAVEAMRLGAHDYVLKRNLARLAPAVEREIREYEVRQAHRAAELSLRTSEMRFSRLAESGIVAIAIADLAGNVAEANDAYLGMLGYDREDLKAGAVKWARHTPEEWKAVDAQAVEELARTGVAAPWEKELCRKDGTRVPVLVGAAMLDAVNCISFVADLTHLKRAQEALRHAEAQLRHAQKMEAVGRLAGGVAHDFNNLLSVILGYTALIAEELGDDDPMRGDVEEIRVAGERAAGLTRQLLAFSRQQVLQPRMVDLGEVVSGTEKMLRRLIGVDVELVTARGEGLGQVRVDPGQMEQVIMNLAVNARDAMPAGGRLHIETGNAMLQEAEHEGAAAGPHVVLAVGDSGVGMDQATQARIFEPFFTTKEPGKGTGLGLSTVFGIVRQSGGSIAVESAPARGTTFRVYLPWATGHDAPVQPAPAAETMRGTETILLVEDEAQVRVVTGTLLRRQGYTVLEARNGADAILLCQQHHAPIQLLLSDVVMPHMSGPHLAEQLRESRPEMRVLFMSGYTDRALVPDGEPGPNAAFIQKPLAPDTLGRKVREVLGASPSLPA
ncbi:MAG TPA: response regulator [Longimicrobiaceae bacterium]|nr:response regulator [Longimicrobiaceae bacterium]